MKNKMLIQSLVITAVSFSIGYAAESKSGMGSTVNQPATTTPAPSATTPGTGNNTPATGTAGEVDPSTQRLDAPGRGTTPGGTGTPAGTTIGGSGTTIREGNGAINSGTPSGTSRITGTVQSVDRSGNRVRVKDSQGVVTEYQVNKETSYTTGGKKGRFNDLKTGDSVNFESNPDLGIITLDRKAR